MDRMFNNTSDPCSWIYNKIVTIIIELWHNIEKAKGKKEKSKYCGLNSSNETIFFLITVYI